MRAVLRRLRRLPLRVRLALASTLILPLALAVVSGLVFLRFEAGLTSAIDSDLRARAEPLAVIVARRGPGALDGPSATALLRPLGAFAQVADRRGRVLGSTDLVRRVRLLAPDQAAVAVARGLRTDRDRIPFVAKRSRLVAIPLPRSGTTLVVGRSLRDREGANESFGRALLLGVPFSLLIAAGACYLAAAAALRPVDRMRRRAAEITGPDLSSRLPVPDVDDEIGRLGHTLNDMLGRLEQSVDRQRELVQNASHELRTPLSVLSAEIELALQHDLDATAREAMETALQEARRVGRLADDLLTLAQLEEHGLPLATETVDVDEVVRLTAARAGRQRAAEGRPIVVDSVTLLADVDPTRVAQAVGNLIDNALVHGEGTVTVTVRDRGDAVEIAVADAGPGIPPTFRASAFDRFAQAGDGPRRGAGLGLAIVKAIAGAHGGAVAITGPPSCVSITLPVGTAGATPDTS